MEYVYAPWRSDYFSKKECSCVFCNISKDSEQDDKNHVFFRNKQIFCVMNKYPYSPGHFLIIPHAHTNSPETIDEDIWIAMNLFAKKGISVLKEFGASGINIGMNLNKEGGAGIPEHIHLHLVPRFGSDTNFFTTIADSRAYGVDFEEVFLKIKNISKKYF
ncbi:MULTISPECIES: HIT family protein [Helicobacter]|uniref:HIT domain-containing protein n=1 Tax=Helicobacter ibis TaxID=2962633 RepID=A0ABT4VEA0_9HELI|nr:MULTISPECIES: HIT domain-containing protein [Helicobacter]MDA3966349.1 HIT domain-containing protein [Helicobacter sp. WB40]MDA3969037.1 HIT domain-containing protein [Helicobacter ibis]